MSIQLKKTEFTKNVLVLFSGSFISQLIPFLVLPILQIYFYDPSDFGLLAVFISFSELFANIAGLKLEFGIVLHNRLKDAINLTYGAFRLILLFFLLSFVLIFIFKESILQFIGNERFGDVLIIVPFYILFFSLNNIMSYWNNREKQFNLISISKIVQTFSAESFKLLFGFLGSTFGLIYGRFFGFVGSVTFFIKHFIRKDVKSLRLLNKKHSNHIVKENKSFVFYTTPSVFIGSLINFVYINLFMHFFGEDYVGILGVSMSYVSAGYSVISVSFSQVFYSKINSIKTKEELLSTYIHFAKRLFFIALVPFLLLHLIPASWISYVLGEKWNDLIYITRISAIWLSIWFVSSSLSFIYMRLGKQKTMLIYDVLHLITIVVGFFVAYTFKPTFISALWGFTIAKALFYVFIILITIRMVKQIDEASL